MRSCRTGRHSVRSHEVGRCWLACWRIAAADLGYDSTRRYRKAWIESTRSRPFAGRDIHCRRNHHGCPILKPQGGFAAAPPAAAGLHSMTLSARPSIERKRDTERSKSGPWGRMPERIIQSNGSRLCITTNSACRCPPWAVLTACRPLPVPTINVGPRSRPSGSVADAVSAPPDPEAHDPGHGV